MRILLPAFVVAVLVASFASAQPAQNVEHAPTVDVCRADSALWNAEALSPKYHVENLSVQELLSRQTEMHKCGLVDRLDPTPQPDTINRISQTEKYAFLFGFYGTEIAVRALDFIARHGLEQKFYAEDAAGAR